MVFCEPRKQMTDTKQRKRYSLVTCMLADFAVGRSFGLAVGLFIKSGNNALYQNMENWFLGEKLIGRGKFFCW